MCKAPVIDADVHKLENLLVMREYLESADGDHIVLMSNSYR